MQPATRCSLPHCFARPAWYC